MGLWRFTKCFWSFLQKKIREQKFENAPFSFGDEMYGDVMNLERAFYPSSYESYENSTFSSSRMSIFRFVFPFTLYVPTVLYVFSVYI